MLSVKEILKQKMNLERSCDNFDITISERDEKLVDLYIDNMHNDGIKMCDSCGDIITEGYVWPDGPHIDCKDCFTADHMEIQRTAALAMSEVKFVEWSE